MPFYKLFFKNFKAFLSACFGLLIENCLKNEECSMQIVEWKRRMDYEKFRAYSRVKKIKNVGQLMRNVEWRSQYAESRMKYEGCMM
jgi:hypothetical protein